MRLRRLKQVKGQALVEFVLVVPIFLLVVVGVFEFGRAISYWLDLNNTAHVAARYAVVNRFPGCTEGPPNCAGGAVPFETWVKSDLNSNALGNAATVTVCYREDAGAVGPTTGDPVTVTITTLFKPIPFLQSADIKLRGRATMRLEQPPSRIGIANSATDPGCSS